MAYDYFAMRIQVQISKTAAIKAASLHYEFS